ncbi:pyridoxal phosphate-dependent transferase [Tricladium varicosporioides]|nr:pyridoxal phosphate-dependent transferase [Hymenoscyphus varicosporioides]
MAVTNVFLRRNLRTLTVWGANTNVGKTIFSTLLCKGFNRRKGGNQGQVYYIKPVSTGPKDEADDLHIIRYSSKTKAQCLYQFQDPVSPHIAARGIGNAASDQDIMQKIQTFLHERVTPGLGNILLETAGGVHSPAPSGTSQADLYRPLRWPAVLIGDSQLGGISSTISAFESLHIRGYDIDLVCMFEDEVYQNHEYLKKYFEDKGIRLIHLQKPPHKQARLESYYKYAVQGTRWLPDAIDYLMEKHEQRIEDLKSMPSRAEQSIWYPFTQHKDLSEQNIVAIDSAYGDFWQTYKNQNHDGVIKSRKVAIQRDTKEDMAAPKADQEVDGKLSTRLANLSTVIMPFPDVVKKTEESWGHPKVLSEKKILLLNPAFDASASWWTQGLGHGNPDLSLAAAYAAGRYGHVIFAGTIHEPALLLAETLLKNLKNPRLSKCFYSDNGSTGMEVATKMAFTAATSRYQWDKSNAEIGVIGLKGSYHGDTIGAMDCSEPSMFNEKVHWYKGRGYWFDFPQVKMSNGNWFIEPAPGQIGDLGKRLEFKSQSDIFEIKSRKQTDVYKGYCSMIRETLLRLVKEEGRTFGAVVMEPVILGAGGMLFVDPLFQHALVETVRESTTLFNTESTPISPPPKTEAKTSWSGLPIIFDEVFTGLYRLGRFTSSSFLRVHPDISVHAKLLTGGLLPLCATLASDSIFSSFLSSEKRDALLHGHSYTAHPIGCHVANMSLKTFLAMEKKREWYEFKGEWGGLPGVKEDERKRRIARQVWSMWSEKFVDTVSRFEGVESVNTLGSVLAINLRDSEGAGYSSAAAAGMQKALLAGVDGKMRIHCRVLGNVLYVMASQTTSVETVRVIEAIILSLLAKNNTPVSLT